MAAKEKKAKGLLELKAHGSINEKEHYLVIRKHGKSLKELASLNRKCFTLETISQIGSQMVDRIESMHSLGYLHQDIKPDNILIGSNHVSSRDFNRLYLIDYGLSEPFLDSSGHHRPQEKTEYFMGNVIFASLNSFRMKTQSRRDDIISLIYVLLFLSEGSLPWMQKRKTKQSDQFHKIGSLKRKLSASEVCNSSPKTKKLLPLLEYAYSLQFPEEPDYKILKSMLTQIVPHKISLSSFKFDWQHLFLKKKKVKKEQKLNSKFSFASEKSLAPLKKEIQDQPNNGEANGRNHTFDVALNSLERGYLAVSGVFGGEVNKEHKRGRTSDRALQRASQDNKSHSNSRWWSIRGATILNNYKPTENRDPQSATKDEGKLKSLLEISCLNKPKLEEEKGNLIRQRSGSFGYFKRSAMCRDSFNEGPVKKVSPQKKLSTTVGSIERILSKMEEDIEDRQAPSLLLKSHFESYKENNLKSICPTKL